MAKAKRKKKFFDVEIGLIKKTIQLYAYEPKELEGRFIKFDLTRILRGKNALLKTKVKLKGEQLKTIPIELKLMPCF